MSKTKPSSNRRKMRQQRTLQITIVLISIIVILSMIMTQCH